MMEKLGAPQTHLGLKAMIVEVDEDKDGKISFREVIRANHYVTAQVSCNYDTLLAPLRMEYQCFHLVNLAPTSTYLPSPPLLVPTYVPVRGWFDFD